MLADTVDKTQRYTIQMRQRGQITIPHQIRRTMMLEAGDSLTIVQVGDAMLLTHKTRRFPQLADKFIDMMDDAGVSLADLLSDLPRMRAEIYEESYGS
jgi:bifunctional DNA-binding transcriptional regulator/antitoxin component of YhaV-PrlF toxin-antitoxin module